MSRSIEVSHLSKRFGAFTAVDDVSFEVLKGEIFGYLGANGAGKSTTIRMLCGLLSPSSGRATVAGHDIALDPEGVKASIGYMSQKFSLYFDLTVWDNLSFFGGAYGLSRRELEVRGEEVLRRTDLADARDAVVGSLPGGIRQRLALACAVLHEPEILFLDEPTAGVDPVARRAFWRLIRQLAQAGTTVFVTTHYLDEAEYCARVGLMVDGRLVALDTPAELKRQNVPDRLFVVRGPELTRAAEQLRSRPGVRAVEPFGAGLHVRTEPGVWDAVRLEEVLRHGGAPLAQVENSEPSLEDVFLAVVRRESRGQEIST
jgi:ABC-2 type transport system ATP-binding protein